MSIDNQHPELKNIPILPEAPFDASELLLPAHAETAPDKIVGADDAATESFLHKHWKKLVATLASVALVAGGGAVAENLANKAPTPQTTSSAKANPSNAPTTSSTPESIASATPTPETSTNSNLINTYEATAPTEFSQLPVDKQRELPLLLINQNMAAYTAAWRSVSNNQQDTYPVASENSSAQDIVDISGWQNRYITNLDGSARINYMQGLFHDGAASPQFAYFKTLTDPYSTATKPQILAYDKALPRVTAGNATPLQTNGSGEKYRDITSTDINGSSVTVRYYYISEDVNGQMLSTWIEQ